MLTEAKGRIQWWPAGEGKWRELSGAGHAREAVQATRAPDRHNIPVTACRQRSALSLPACCPHEGEVSPINKPF